MLQLDQAALSMTTFLQLLMLISTVRSLLTLNALRKKLALLSTQEDVSFSKGWSGPIPLFSHLTSHSWGEGGGGEPPACMLIFGILGYRRTICTEHLNSLVEKALKQICAERPLGEQRVTPTHPQNKGEFLRAVQVRETVPAPSGQRT